MVIRSGFPEWYGHDLTAIKTIVTTGTISFDTNALLDLYRRSKDQREQILEALGIVSERIFIPHHVGFEFNKHRLSVVHTSRDIYKNLLKSNFELDDQKLHKNFGDKQVRQEIKDLFRESRETFEKTVEIFEKKLEKLRDKHTIGFDDMFGNDPVLEALEHLLTEESIGQRPEPQVLEERRAVATTRLDAGVPPGFKDSEKDDPTGDYLIWCELLDHAESSGRPLLFVTNDKKEDWYRKPIGGKSLGPRTELVIEMRERCPSCLYHQADLGSFLHYAKEYLGAAVEDGTITTVTNIAADAEEEYEAAEKYRDAAATAARAEVLYNQALHQYLATRSRFKPEPPLPTYYADVHTRLGHKTLVEAAMDAGKAFQDLVRIPDAYRPALGIGRQQTWHTLADDPNMLLAASKQILQAARAAQARPPEDDTSSTPEPPAATKEKPEESSEPKRATRKTAAKKAPKNTKDQS